MFYIVIIKAIKKAATQIGNNYHNKIGVTDEQHHGIFSSDMEFFPGRTHINFL
jgi:hypothetical protein